MEKIIVSAPMVAQPFMAVRIETDPYKIDRGVAVTAPHSEVVANVLISAVGEYTDTDRALPEEIEALSNYRFLPSGVGATEWISEQASNIKFTYPSGKTPEIVEREWNSGKESITREGARLDSANEEVLTSDFSILGQQYAYAIAIVFEPNVPDSNLSSQVIMSTSGSDSPWSLVLRGASIQLVDSENPYNTSNDVILSHSSLFSGDIPIIVVVSIHKEKLELHSLSSDSRVRTSSVPVSYLEPEPLSLIVGTDVRHYMKYADAVIYEINLFTEIEESFNPVSIINIIEEAYGVKQW
jgi:hypothetical protein